jgi:hypothetical protein
MNTAIELHDSKCLALEINRSGSGSLLLNAYVHRSEGEPGVSKGEGGVQKVRLEMDEMELDGEVGDLPAYIYEGAIAIGESVQDNLISFPATYSGAIRISLMLAEDARVIAVSGTRLSIEAESEFRFVEPVDFTGSHSEASS